MKLLRKKHGNQIKTAAIVLLIVLLLTPAAGCADSSTAAGQTDEAKTVYTDVRELDGQVIAMLDGTSDDAAIQALFPEAVLQYYPTYVDCMTAVKNGRAAAYIAEEPLVRCQLEESGGLTYFPDELIRSEYAFMLNKDDTALQQEINTVLADFADEGVLDRLEQEWVLKKETQTADTAAEAPAGEKKGTLNVIVCSDAEPFCYIENGEPTGYEVALIQRIADRLGYDVTFHVAEFSAFMPAIMEGKMDVALGCISVTPERQEAVGFSDAEYSCSVVAVIADDSEDTTGFFAGIGDSFYRTFVKESRWKMLWDGLLVTIRLSVVSLIFGSLLGFAASFALRSTRTWIRRTAQAVSTFLDGLPLVVLLMVLYYILFRGINIPAVWVGIIGFTLDFANAVAGLVNTGVSSVDAGQIEAAAAMGYSNMQIFWKIIFPQAAQQMFSQYEGAVVSMIKGTSIIGYITVEDLTKAGDMIRSRTYEAFFPLIVTAVAYFLIAYLFIAVLQRVALRLDPKRRPRKIKGVQTGDND